MANIEVKDVSGKKVEVRDLNAGVFGIEPNVHVMHQVVRAQRASWRQGTHDTLTRGQVRGGGKSRGVRRAPVVPARVPSALLSGVAVAPCSVHILVHTPSA